jgi:HEAT repeat protein
MNLEATIKKLTANLSSSIDLTRVKARKELVAIGKPAVPFLIEALKNPNHLERWEAAKVLGEVGEAEAASALVEALDDEEFEVRWRAAEALIRMKTKGLKPLLHALIQNADSAFLREGAHHVLHELAKGELRAYLTPVLIALGSFEPAAEVPAGALRALETMEELLKIAKKRESSSLRQLTVAMPSQRAAEAHKRARWYARSLHRV